MSLATMAAPVVLSAPDTAQLLLPIVASSSRGRRAHHGRSPPVGGVSSRAIAPFGARTTVNTSAPGTGGTGVTSPSMGLSQSLARPARNSNIGAGSTSAIVPSVCS